MPGCKTVHTVNEERSLNLGRGYRNMALGKGRNVSYTASTSTSRKRLPIWNLRKNAYTRSLDTVTTVGGMMLKSMRTISGRFNQLLK